MSQRRAKTRPPKAFTIPEIAYCLAWSEKNDPEGVKCCQDVLALIAKQSDNAVSSLLGIGLSYCLQGLKSDAEVLDYVEQLLGRIRKEMRKVVDERPACPWCSGEPKRRPCVECGDTGIAPLTAAHVSQIEDVRRMLGVFMHPAAHAVMEEGK